MFIKQSLIYKLKKVLYGLKQEPSTWYQILKTFLIGHKFTMRSIDQTLFIKAVKDNIALIHIYVDDIIFESTNATLCKEFSKMM